MLSNEEVGAMLVESSVITEDQLAEALKVAADTQRSLQRALIEKNVTTKEHPEAVQYFAASQGWHVAKEDRNMQEIAVAQFPHESMSIYTIGFLCEVAAMCFA